MTADFGVGAGVEPKSIVLFGQDRRSYLGAIAADVNRLSLAARESLYNIRSHTELPRSVAWPLVMIYYASLFSAQMLLRVWGDAPSYLRTEELLHLRRVGAAYGVLAVGHYNTGQYMIGDNAVSGQIDFRPINGAGSHEAVWRALDIRMSSITSLIAGSGSLTSQDKIDASKDVAHLVKMVTKAGAGAKWLSTFRNDLQYRQAYGAWFPYRDGRMTVERIVDRVRDVVSGAVDIEQFEYRSADDITAFSESCLALICATRMTLVDMYERNPAGSFLRFGYRRLEATLG